MHVFFAKLFSWISKINDVSSQWIFFLLVPFYCEDFKKRESFQSSNSLLKSYFFLDHVPGLLRELRHLVPRQQHLSGPARVFHKRQQHDRQSDLYLSLSGNTKKHRDVATFIHTHVYLSAICNDFMCTTSMTCSLFLLFVYMYVLSWHRALIGILQVAREKNG